MNFIEAIRSGFNNYFNFKGRASKSAFWYFLLFEFIYFFIAGFLLGMIGVNDDIFAIATIFVAGTTPFVCLPSICIWALFGSSIKLIIKNTKIKKSIEYLFAVLLVVTAVIIVVD